MAVENTPRRGGDAMDKERKPVGRRTDVLRKLNAENLSVIERGLLGDLPERLKPSYKPVQVRGRPTDLLVAKPSGFLSSCLPVVPDSPGSEKVTSSDDEVTTPTLKKTFSFRDKFSKRISFLNRKEKHQKRQWTTIVEDEKNSDLNGSVETEEFRGHDKKDHDYKSSKRFWFFRNKEVEKKLSVRPAYKRSKSFEFLPRAIEEEEEIIKPRKLKNSASYVFGSSDSIGDAWTSNESLEYISNVYYDKDDDVFLKSVKEISPESSKNSSSTISAASGLAANIFNTASVQNLLEEFDKAVDLFSEVYQSDSEPYTQNKILPIEEKRKSCSFSTLPSPKVMHVAKVQEISEDFKSELARVLSEKRASAPVTTSRRGSVTDWFVLEDHTGVEKYRRGQRKPLNRVRRMSSTKYWITPEECAVYSREQRPPLVIPRITHYRRDARAHPPIQHHHQGYQEKDQATVKNSVRQYERLQDWSPSSERSRGELDRSFSKANSDSPPFVRINKRLGGSTENLLTNVMRPKNLPLPASSSGDSLDVEVRDKPVYPRSRKSRSMVAPKHVLRSPIPAPRTLIGQSEPEVILEGPVKRTKFFEGNKKCRKNWVDCYMTLTPTALVFYKDQRTYQASKAYRAPGTPPSPTAPRAELVLPLLNAHVNECIQMHTRRYTKSLVLTVNYDQYLLQDETEEGARRWLKEIQSVYYKLGPSRLEDYPTHYQSSNTDVDSVGRTPPVSRHAHRNNQKAGGSSNEDLSDSTEVSLPRSKEVKRRLLRNFFAKRPTMDALKQKGIYQDEQVFGRKLEEVCPKVEGVPKVPQFVVECVKEIESNEENMCTDGLYRASGNLSQVQKIRLEVDQNNLKVITDSTDIHVLTGSLKLFFRELKEPLIPCSLFDRVLAACSIKPREAKIKEFRSIIKALPQCNRDTLKFLLEHLLRVTKYSERNRMHTANLAIVFGPTLLWAPAEQAHNIAIDCIQQNHVVEILLNDYHEIFADDTKAKKKT